MTACRPSRRAISTCRLAAREGSLLKRCPDPHGQSAHTHYQVLSAANGRALLRLTPTTGRTHQLRVHMAAIGCPLTGDWLYGTEDRTLIARPALHSYHLRMVHPVTGAVIDVTAPPAGGHAPPALISPKEYTHTSHCQAVSFVVY